MQANQTLVLGVDGGGTKTAVCLAAVNSHGEPTILATTEANSSNVRAVGAEQAFANLEAGIDAAWLAAGLIRHPVAEAIFGLSGAGHSDVQKIVSIWISEKKIANHFEIVHDALPVLAAGTEKGEGVALIAGTGAVAYAVNELKQTAITGGWGYWFGDEGGAFWLGQAAVRAVSHAADRRGSQTQLTVAILNRLEITNPRDLLSTLSANGDVRSALATLAVVVTECAEHGDVVAVRIVEEAAGHLADLVVSASQQLTMGPSFPLAVAGGVITRSSLIRERLRMQLMKKGMTPTAINTVTNPVTGCIKLAIQNLPRQ